MMTTGNIFLAKYDADIVGKIRYIFKAFRLLWIILLYDTVLHPQ